MRELLAELLKLSVRMLHRVGEVDPAGDAYARLLELIELVVEALRRGDPSSDEAVAKVNEGIGHVVRSVSDVAPRPRARVLYRDLTQLAVLHQQIVGGPDRAVLAVLRAYPDEVLVLLVQERRAGWRLALEVFWHDHRHDHRWEKRVIARFTRMALADGNRDRNVPYELAAVVLLAIYRGSTYDPERAPAWAYVWGIVRNVYRAYCHCRGNKKGVSLDGLDGFEPEAPGPPDIDVEMDLDAIACLPDEQRQVLQLWLSGWPDGEIARAIGMTKEEVQKARHRAKVRLREQRRREKWIEDHSNSLFQPRGRGDAQRRIVPELRPLLSRMEAEAIERKTDTRTYARIAGELGCSPSAVWGAYHDGAGKL